MLEDNPYELSREETSDLVLMRKITTSVSMLSSAFMILIYVYILTKIHVKRKKITKINRYLTNNSLLNSSINEFLNEHQNSKLLVKEVEQDKVNFSLGFASHLIFALSLTNLLFGISTFINIKEYYETNDVIDLTCKVQGFLLNFFEMSSISWNFCIVYTLKMGITEKIQNKQKLLIIIIVNAYLLPLSLSTAYIFIYL